MRDCLRQDRWRTVFLSATRERERIARFLHNERRLDTARLGLLPGQAETKRHRARHGRPELFGAVGEGLWKNDAPKGHHGERGHHRQTAPTGEEGIRRDRSGDIRLRPALRVQVCRNNPHRLQGDSERLLRRRTQGQQRQPTENRHRVLSHTASQQS